MSFWLYDPTSIKDSTLFPSGAFGNFLNTITIAIMAFVALLKTKFKGIVDDQTLIKYAGTSFLVVTLLGLIMCRGEQSNSSSMIGESYNFDLTFD